MTGSLSYTQTGSAHPLNDPHSTHSCDAQAVATSTDRQGSDGRSILSRITHWWSGGKGKDRSQSDRYLSALHTAIVVKGLKTSQQSALTRWLINRDFEGARALLSASAREDSPVERSRTEKLFALTDQIYDDCGHPTRSVFGPPSNLHPICNALIKLSSNEITE